MKRELAFALGAQSLILDSAGKTRSNRASSDCNGVPGSRSRKRVKTSAGEEQGAFSCSSVEIEDSGIRSSVGDEFNKKGLTDNDIASPIAAFDDLVRHSSIGTVNKNAESTVLAEPIVLDSSVAQIKEPEGWSNGDLGVDVTSPEVETKEAVSEIMKSKCEVEVQTAFDCTPISKDCSVVHLEKGLCLSNGIRDLHTGKSNAVDDSPVHVKSKLLASGLGNAVVEILHGTETKNGGAMTKEGDLINGELKTLAEKPQRRFTRSALMVNEKDPKDLSGTETNMTSTGNEVNPVTFDRNHRPEPADINKKHFREDSFVNCTKSASPKNFEVDDLKQNSFDKIPKTVRELFATGILEGCKVYYNGGKKDPVIRGIIKGFGILCSCDICQGSKVFLPAQFEIHACKSYRRAAQYICLENGRSLIDILHLCRGTELKKLETKIRNAVGLCAKKETVCQDCKGPFSIDNFVDKSCTKKFLPSEIPPITSGKTRGLPQKGLSKSPRSIQMAKCSLGKARGCFKNKQSTLEDSTPKISLRPGKKRGRRPKNPTQAHNSSKGPSLESSSQRKAGKITRKDLKMHRLVFDDAGLPDGTELAYFVRGEKILEGYKKDSGIFCRCCDEVVSASQFESHAGFATRRKPYSNIYTSNGVSLHELAVSLLKSSRRDVEESDDLCMICADGGELLLCDGCPRAFHKECISLTHQPQGTWFCRYCESAFERDRSVQWNANAIAAGRVSGVDSIEQISNRSIRIVKDFQEDATSCYLCRGLDFSKSGFGPRTIIICDQCEREYHVGCLKTHKMAYLEDLPQGEWFCNTNCQMIRSSLQSLLNHEAEKLPSSLLDVLRDKLRAHNADIPSDSDVSWKLLSGQVSSEARATTRPLLSQAISILHEGFGTIVDAVTGRDLIPSIVYGRKVRNREFRGMYCAVLLVKSVVASVAVFRLFGQELVELPLVATRGDYRGKGCFQALFGCIERLFASHGVKTIVLPAAEGAEDVWLKFGFKKITSDQVSEYKKTYWQITEFTGVVMLEKPVSAGEVIINPTENAPQTITSA